MSDYLEIARQVMREQGVKADQPIESVLKGYGIELWSDALGERFWLVSDEEDAARLGEKRGSIYTAAEARRVIQINDAPTVAEVHRWKQQFDAIISEFRPAAQHPNFGQRAGGAVATGMGSFIK